MSTLPPSYSIEGSLVLLHQIPIRRRLRKGIDRMKKGILEFSSNAHYRYLHHSYSLYVSSRLRGEKDRLRRLIHRWSRECKLERKEEDLSELSWSWSEVELDRKKV